MKGPTDERADALATLRFAIVNGLARNAHVHRLAAGPEADLVVEDVVASLTASHTLWALEVIARRHREGGGS